MRLINHTRMPATFTVGMDPDGRESLVIVVKGTFTIPADGGVVRLSEEQAPFILADVFSGDPASSAPLYEVDFALRKLRCDVLLNGSAHAPDQRPATRVQVGVAIGDWSKTFEVVGNRQWVSGVSGFGATAATPFVRLPISYDVAFGGIDAHHEDDARRAVFAPNPVGRGFHHHLEAKWIEGSPLPNTQELHEDIRVPNGRYRPMAFGPLGRGWESRIAYAGTYDQQWLDEVFPFLPRDFDDRYYQGAPADQQIAFPTGEQTITLLNLTPDGRRTFRIPAFRASLQIEARSGAAESGALTLDTIVIEPDQERMWLTWRCTRPLRRDIFEIAQVVIGNGTRLFPVRLAPAENAALIPSAD